MTAVALHTQTRALAQAARPGSWNPERRTIDVIAATETPVLRRDPFTGERFYEVLEITRDAIDLGRFIGAPILNTHNAGDLRNTLGIVVDAWIEGRQLIARLELTDRPDVAGLVNDIVAGRLRNVSVGYQVSTWADETAGAA